MIEANSWLVITLERIWIIGVTNLLTNKHGGATVEGKTTVLQNRPSSICICICNCNLSCSFDFFLCCCWWVSLWESTKWQMQRCTCAEAWSFRFDLVRFDSFFCRLNGRLWWLLEFFFCLLLAVSKLIRGKGAKNQKFQAFALMFDGFFFWDFYFSLAVVFGNWGFGYAVVMFYWDSGVFELDLVAWNVKVSDELQGP